jgi:hypothetical protein
VSCHGYFQETHGTPLHGKRVSPDMLLWAVGALAEGLGIRAVARVFGSYTSSLRIIQSPKNQVASLRFSDLGGGTRDGARPAFSCTSADWNPGALSEPDLGLATATRRNQPRPHAGQEAFTRAQAVSRPHP